MKTTVNGKEIKLFNENDIAELYTKYVMSYLDVGYNFYFYSGTQGEDVKTCLTKDGGKTVYILFVDSEYNHFNEIKTIWIKRYENVVPGRTTLWLNEGEEVFKKEFYVISEKRYGKVYVDNKEDFETLNNIYSERLSMRYDLENIEKFVELSESCYKTALKVIRNKKGYKSVQLKDIRKIQKRISIKYGNGYEFFFNNGKSSLYVEISK